MRALLALEDGSVHMGRAFGALGESGGEVVFQTAMTGYQEILTDPSYHGQIVVFTTPHIGNYGIHEGHGESAKPHVAGVVVREICEQPSHPGSRRSVSAWLREHEIFGITDVDTRALTLRIRRAGTLRGWMTTLVADPADAVARARAVPPMDLVPAVSAVTTRAIWSWSEVSARFGDAEPVTGGPQVTGVAPVMGGSQVTGLAQVAGDLPLAAVSRLADGPLVAVLDCGVKYSILRELAKRGCRILVLPAEAAAEAVDHLAPDGLVLSNGPGDPRALSAWLPRIERILESRPTLAVCLGHQLAGLAFGCRIVKLHFGHHGGNHPVMDLRTRHVAITAQNHNYAVDPASVPAELEVTHQNLNDGTVEGMRHRTLPLWSLQFHPEAGPGPHEATVAFDEFVGALRARRGADGKDGHAAR